MNVQSTRRARRDAERTRRSGRTAVAGGLATLLLGGVGLGFVVFDDAQQSSLPTVPAECVSTQRVPVVTDSTMADVLGQKPVDSQSCIVLETTSHGEQLDGQTEPRQDMSAGLWIPDSSAFFPTTPETNRFTVHTDSLATTSPVIVAPEHTRDFTTWTDVIADNSVQMGNPSQDGAAHAATRSAAAEVQNNTVSEQQLRRAMISRTVSGTSTQEAVDEAELLENSVNQGRRVVVSEKSYLDFVRTHPRGDEVRALVPDSGAWLLDYPLLVPSEAANRNATIAQAAEEIAAFLESDRGREVLSEHRVRGVEGRRLPDSRSAPISHRLFVEDESDWQRLMTTWTRQTSAHNALYVLDASRSMGRENPQAERSFWQTAVDSTVIRSQFIPTRDSIGLWTSFATEGSDPSHQELVPIRRMDEYVDDSPHRQRVQDALARAELHEDAESGLYSTTLDAFRAVQQNYREGAVNSVVIISDDSQDRGDTEKLNDLVRTLKQEQDREKPVYIVTIAISGGDPPQDLKEISEATGGTSHAGASLQDIQERYLHTLATFCCPCGAHTGSAVAFVSALPVFSANVAQGPWVNRRPPQWKKCRAPVKYMVTPAACAAAMTSSSRIEPPGWTTARTPASSSTCRPSANGKNASDAATAPRAR